MIQRIINTDDRPLEGPQDASELLSLDVGRGKWGKGFRPKSMRWQGSAVRVLELGFGDDPVRLSLYGEGITSPLRECFLRLRVREAGAGRGRGCVTRRRDA